MRKLIAGIVHALSVLLIAAAVSLLIIGLPAGAGLSLIRQPEFVNSSAFENLVSENINDIFDYTDLRDLFESNGKLDLNKVIAQAESGGKTVSYNLDYLIRYARSRGYYLNEKNQVVAPENTSEFPADKNTVNVVYRAYMPDFKPQSPSDGFMTLTDLSLETLDYLAKYYALRSNYFDAPSNMKFCVYYYSSGRSTTYSNAPDDSPEDMLSHGKYLYTSSDTIEVKTNLSKVPSNVIPILQAKNPYSGGSYYFVFGIDTTFPYSDSLQAAYNTYTAQRNTAITAVVMLGMGILLGTVSLCALVCLAGHAEISVFRGNAGGFAGAQTRRPAEYTGGRTEAISGNAAGRAAKRTAARGSIQLIPFDRVPIEVLMLLFACCVYAASRVSAAFTESVYRLLGAFAHIDYWSCAIALLLDYAACFAAGMSLIRRYKADQLWHTTLLRRLCDLSAHYIRSAQLTTSRLFSYVMFILPNLACAALIIVLYVRFFTMKSLLSFLTASALIVILGAIDFYAYNISTGLSDAVNEQVKSERLKADLITNVSHDIKTPLTSIISYVDLLKREKIENPRIQGYIEVLDQKSSRLKTLTEDLVEASKASSGNINMEFARLDLTEMAQQAVGEFEDKFRVRRLDTVCTIPDHPIYVMADGRRLWRVLENLLNNAGKYAMEGSRIYIDVAEDEETAFFTIKNISEAPLNISPEELTERFVRGDVSRTTEGSGLGLSIAKSLTTLMHGKLTITIDGDLYKASVSFPLNAQVPPGV